MPLSKIAPDWIKAQKGLTDSMKVLAERVKALDTHFVGMVRARQAQKKVQDGPLDKVKATLRTDTKMVRKALEANKTDKNKKEVKDLTDLIDGMFSGKGNVVWDTSKTIMDVKKADAFAKAALKKWNDSAKKSKDKMVKKILSKSKTPALLAAISKMLPRVAAANEGFRGHHAKFSQAHVFLGKGLDDVAKDLKNVAVALKKARADADKMDAVPM